MTDQRDTAGAPTGRAVEEELRELVSAAQQELSTGELPRSLQRFLGALFQRVRRCDSYAEALKATVVATAELTRAAEVGIRLQAEVSRRQQARSAVEPFGEAWKEITEERLRDAGDDARTIWIERYAEAFAVGRFDICDWLSGGGGTDASGGVAQLQAADRSLSRRMLLSARAAEAGNLAASLPALEVLTESTYAGSLPPELLFRVWAMRIRAVDRGLGDPARARELAEAVLERAQTQRALSGDVLAALYTAYGECLLDVGDAQEATRAVHLALTYAPEAPAGHVLCGLVAESVQDFIAANESYEEAAKRGSVDGELFAPIPPNLLWQHGRRLRRSDPRRASRLIRRALAAGLRGSGPYPERKAYVDLAVALEQRCERPDEPLPAKQRAEAAEAYWEAGRRYAWVGDEISAVGFLEKAGKLDGSNSQYAFELAEVLRLRAVHEDGTVDLDQLASATYAWRQAYALGPPASVMRWAYCTRALIAHEESGDLYRPRPSWPAVEWLERGLLCDPTNVRTMAQLSQAYRLVGDRRTALELIEAASQSDDEDELVFDQHLLALLEVERAQEALERVNAHGLRTDQPWLVVRKVQLHLTLGHPDDALGLLETARPLDQALNDLYVGLSHELLDHQQAARQAFERIADGAGSARPGRRGDLAAWACYLLGRYDEAESGYRKLMERQPRDASLLCELGQLLLARGDEERDDPRTGRRLLIDGIEATRSLWSLTMLERIDLPRLARRLSDQGAPAGDAVKEIGLALRQRVRELRRDNDPVAELEARVRAPEPAIRQAALLGLARLHLTAGSGEEALGRYVELAAEVPEAVLGTEVAGHRLRRIAGELADRGDRKAARATYERLLELLERLPSPPVELTAAAHLRAALVALELGRRDEFERHTSGAFPPGSEAAQLPAVQEALSAVFARPAHYWQVVDAARAIRDDGPGVRSGRPAEPAAGRLVAALDAAALLRARQSDIGAASLFPLATPLAVRLGPGLHQAPGPGAQPLYDLLEEARRRVEEETGVPIPGVGVRPMPEGAGPNAYAIELYEVEVARGAVPPADLSDVEMSWRAERLVVRHLELVIRSHLPRLFDIDDVGIWLASSSSGAGSVPHADRLGLADRLELMRLLRLLLREQVPIRDVAAIVDVVYEAGPEWSALDLLPAVRQRLRSGLAPGDVPPIRVPEALEAGFSAGFSAGLPSRWELPRTEVVALAERLADWYRAQAAPGVVVVREARLRPFFWRLLAVLVPGPIPVLTEEELDGPE